MGVWIKEELYPVRNFHQGFENGLPEGLFKSAIQQVLGGKNVGPDFKNHAGYKKHASTWMVSAGRRMAAKRRWDRQKTMASSRSTS